MQWLVDLVIEAIRIIGMFVNRGDPPAVDFDLGDLTADSNWHVLDLSDIVPENAHCVAISVVALNTGVNKWLVLRTHGNVNENNAAQLQTQTAFIVTPGDLTVPLVADRKIDYNIKTGGWVAISFVVKGWWY